MSPAADWFGILLFFILTVLAEILGTVGGFGSSLFFVSFSQILFDFKTTLALTGLLHVVSNTAKIFLFRKTIEWKLVLTLGISSVVLALAGAYLTTRVDFTYARLLLGIFLVAFSLFFYFAKNFTLTATTVNSVVGGGIAGFLAGFIGTGGAVRGLVLASFNLEKNLFVGTSAAIDFGVDLGRTIIYMDNQFLGRDHLIYVPVIIVASFAGNYYGKKVIDRISQITFRRILLGLVFIMGLLLIVGA